MLNVTFFSDKLKRRIREEGYFYDNFSCGVCVVVREDSLIDVTESECQIEYESK